MTEAQPFQPVAPLFSDITSDVVMHLKPLLDSSVRVCINLTTWKRPQPCVQIVRTGGTASGLIDNAVLQVDVRHEDWDTTMDLAQEVRSHLLFMAAELPDVVKVREASGPRWFPDPDGGARVMMSVAVSVSCAQRL